VTAAADDADQAAAADPAAVGDLTALRRENLYLRQRAVDLQSDLTDVTAESDRLRQMLERLHGRRPAQRPDPLSGGQSA
jgi:hypothetical protein